MVSTNKRTTSTRGVGFGSTTATAVAPRDLTLAESIDFISHVCVTSAVSHGLTPNDGLELHDDAMYVIVIDYELIDLTGTLVVELSEAMTSGLLHSDLRVALVTCDRAERLAAEADGIALREGLVVDWLLAMNTTGTTINSDHDGNLWASQPSMPLRLAANGALCVHQREALAAISQVDVAAVTDDDIEDVGDFLGIRGLDVDASDLDDVAVAHILGRMNAPTTAELGDGINNVYEILFACSDLSFDIGVLFGAHTFVEGFDNPVWLSA